MRGTVDKETQEGKKKKRHNCSCQSRLQQAGFQLLSSDPNNASERCTLPERWRCGTLLKGVKWILQICFYLSITFPLWTSRLFHLGGTQAATHKTLAMYPLQWAAATSKATSTRRRSTKAGVEGVKGANSEIAGKTGKLSKVNWTKPLPSAHKGREQWEQPLVWPHSRNNRTILHKSVPVNRDLTFFLSTKKNNPLHFA